MLNYMTKIMNVWFHGSEIFKVKTTMFSFAFVTHVYHCLNAVTKTHLIITYIKPILKHYSKDP